jgi:hypothetical protein
VELLSTSFEQNARAAAAIRVDYAMYTHDISERLRDVHTVKCVRSVYSTLKRLLLPPLIADSHQEHIASTFTKYDRHALKKLRRVKCALHARWHALKILKSTKQKQRLLTALEMLKSECLQLLCA